MKNTTGFYSKTWVGGEEVSAFVPNPLPPKTKIDFSDKVHTMVQIAEKNLFRLELATDMVLSMDWFIYAFVRKEAVLSSQIEGTQCTLVDLLDFEFGSQGKDAEVHPDLDEVCNYLDALKYARGELAKKKGLPLSMRLLNKSHAILMRGVRGKNKCPGEIRRSQNWIGGTRPGNAHFVPTPPDLLPGVLSDFEKYIHSEDGYHPLIRCALLHVQFETIHPYLDGNGRIGRLLITLLLEEYGLLSEPILYLSLFFKRHQREYYLRLSEVRDSGDWEGWVLFFLEAVVTITTEATESAKNIFNLFAQDRRKILNSSASSIVSVQLFEKLCNHPIMTISQVTSMLHTSKPTATKAVQNLIDLGILLDDGKKRNRSFRYEEYLNYLNVGTEL